MPQDTRLGKNGGKLPQFRSLALVAVGSNQHFRTSDVTETVQSAIELISKRIGPIIKKSRLYRTPAFPPGAGPDFVNAALSIRCALTPSDLLAALHDIEATFGRERQERWAPRTLDLDLVAIGDLVLPDKGTQRDWVALPLADQMKRTPETLILPHPRLQDRGFVLVPLADIASEWRHPVSGRTVAEMLDALPDSARKEVQLL